MSFGKCKAILAYLTKEFQKMEVQSLRQGLGNEKDACRASFFGLICLEGVAICFGAFACGASAAIDMNFDCRSSAMVAFLPVLTIFH